MKADLHVHTIHSDGVCYVGEIIELAKKRGLAAVAVTDHDVLQGALEAEKLSTQELKVIVGLELSTEYKGESVHILGYFKDGSGLEAFERFLAAQRKNRLKRAYKIRDRLAEHFNIDLDMGFAQEAASVTRGTIAREIISQGHPYTQEEIFEKMLGNGRAAYIPSTKMDPVTGIRKIHEFGGLAVLAHPVLLKNSEPEEIIVFGIDGIEAIYPANTSGDEERFRRLASRHGLFITGGSDFHAPGDSQHGELAEFVLSGRDLEIFFERLGFD
ncbi:MAG: PHP domain-containing protein [Bacilli bacterium]|jgi:predicted metal-dependent phosphoesterase TrpH